MSIPGLQHLTKTIRREGYPSIDPTNPANSAAGKHVLITGGAGGIGYAIAQGFSAAGAATIIITARRQAYLDEGAARLRAENAAAGRTTEVWPYLLDVRDATAIDAAFADVRKRLNDGVPAKADGSLAHDVDVLVTSAAYLEQGYTVVETPEQQFRDALETNVIGNVSLVRAFLAPEAPAIPLTALTGQVKDTTGARTPTREKVVLDVSSGAAYFLLPGQAPYSSSKGAFTRLMRVLQAELDTLDRNPVRVHSFNPGVIYSPGVARAVKDKDVLPWDEESLPAGFAVWLASPAAKFLKGRFVLSCWDVDEMIAMKDRFEADPDYGTITLKI